MSTPSLDTALALHRAGRTADAEAAYSTCIDAGVADAAASLAVLLLQGGRYGEAITVLQPLVDAAPDNPELAVNLSLALRREGHGAAAHAAAERATRLAPERAATWNALGLAALDIGKPADALAAFDAGLRVAPRMSALRLHRAQTLQRLGRVREAHDAFAQLARDMPTLRDAWRGLAQAQSALGHAAAARQSNARVAQFEQSDAEAAFQRGMQELQSGNAAAAMRTFRSLLDGGRIRAPLCWFWLGRAQVGAGDLDAARLSFANAVAGEPDNPDFAHFHAAAIGALPATIERRFIAGLFDAFADNFEQSLVGELAYSVPALLPGFIARQPGTQPATVLDLGCGTGLMGAALARDGLLIDGIDLSPRMLEHARAKGIYRELHVAELLAFLDATSAQWDLVVAADVFVYIAALEPVFAAVFEHLAPGGAFAFSIERSETVDAELIPNTGRYRHAPQHAHAVLNRTGFVDVASEPVTLRTESGVPVLGELMFARRAMAPANRSNRSG